MKLHLTSSATHFTTSWKCLTHKCFPQVFPVSPRINQLPIFK